MSLTDIWLSSREQLADKMVKQIISFAGAGQLRDGSEASEEFRNYLSRVPSAFLARYADECLRESFDDSGFALQDIINSCVRWLSSAASRQKRSLNLWVQEKVSHETAAK